MRLRTLFALTVVLVLAMTGIAAAQEAGEGMLVFEHDISGRGPVAVGVSDPTDPDAGAFLGVVEEGGEARTTLRAGTHYVLAVAPPDALDEPLAVTEELTIVENGFHVVTASGAGEAIRFEVFNGPTPPPPGPTGDLLVQHRTSSAQTFAVTIIDPSGLTSLSDLFELPPGEAVRYDNLRAVPHRLEVADLQGTLLAEIDDLPIVAGETTVVTVLADGDGIRLTVSGEGATPAPTPSPATIRTPSRIETGAGGSAPEQGGLPAAALLALGLLASASALVALPARSSRTR